MSNVIHAGEFALGMIFFAFVVIPLLMTWLMEREKRKP